MKPFVIDCLKGLFPATQKREKLSVPNSPSLQHLQWSGDGGLARGPVTKSSLTIPSFSCGPCSQCEVHGEKGQLAPSPGLAC